MAAWLVRRLAAWIAIVWAVVTLTFVIVHLAHGSPCGEPDGRPIAPEVCADLTRRSALDRPLWVQYVKSLGALLRGDLGEWLSLARPVADALADALPNPFMLALTALILDFALGLALGVYQAARERRFGDIALGNAALFVNSMPTFWLGLVLLLVFGQRLGWVPVGGLRGLVLCPRGGSLPRAADFAWHLALPALTLGLGGAASTARDQRAALPAAGGPEFARTPRA